MIDEARDVALVATRFMESTMNIYRHVYAIVGFGIVLAGLSVASSPMAKVKAAPPTQPVAVMNTSSNPVPVSVNGTATVTGTVNVGNQSGSPVPVRDMDASAKTPFTFSTGFQLGQFDTEKNSG